ncbi:MAG: hypothetical protein ACRDBO_17195 [Lachnospiraceae bacterium]
MKTYIGYIINKSQKDKKIFKDLIITNKKTIWFGLITIYEVQIDSSKMEAIIKRIQNNMVSHIGIFKQEFYAHFYCGTDLIVIFREKAFQITSDKSTWKEAQLYGKSIGIVEKQLDFLTPEENRKRYFS